MIKAAILLICIVGAFLSMLEISSLTIVVVSPLDSFRALFNHIFSISEQHQSYEYVRFVTPSDNYENYIFIAITILVVAVAAFIFILHKRKPQVMGACVFLLFIGLQVYFGFFAVPFWNIALFIVIAILSLQDAKLKILAPTIAVVVIAAVLIFPGQSSALALFNENIRDSFGNMQERTLPTDPQDIATSPLPQDAHLQYTGAGSGGHGYEIYEIEHFAGSQIGAAIGQRLWLLWLIGLAFVAGFIVAFILRLVSAFKRRAAFDSADCAKAIDVMFKHTMQLLARLGVPPQNVPYSQYPLVFSPEYTANYKIIVGIWERAVYSSHAMTETDKNHVKKFLEETKKKVSVYIRIGLFLKKEASAGVVLLLLLLTLTGCRMRIVEVAEGETQIDIYDYQEEIPEPIVDPLAYIAAYTPQGEALDGVDTVGYIEQETPTDVPGETALDDGGDGTLGLIIDRYTGILSRGLGSLFECQRLYVYFESLQAYHTVNRFSAEHRLIIDSGGHNVAAMRGNNSLTVDTGWVQRRNPAVIVRVVGSDMLGANVASPARAQAIRSEILQRPYWDGINAVLHRRVLVLSEELLATEEGRLVAKLYMASVMYPTLFADIDVAELVRQVYGGAGVFAVK